jgi:adenosine deaminase
MLTRRFFQHFGTYVYHFLCSTRANIFALNAVLADFLADGVVYVELRTSVRDLPGNAILGDGPASAADNIAATCAALREWNADAVKGQMQARLILSINRQHDTLSKALEIVKLAIDLRDKGEPVVGIDLSGDVYSPLRDYSKAFALASEAGLPLSLHFAEVPESSSREELETLLSFNPSRLGHVIHTPPDIRQRILERRIPVELLLTCNILGDMLPAAELGPVDTAKPTRNMDDEYRRHHFEYYYNAGHPLSLGTDDVGVFGSKLSEEYALVSNHFGLGREALIDVSRKGVDGIFDPSQKRAVLDLIDAFARKDGASVEA